MRMTAATSSDATSSAATSPAATSADPWRPAELRLRERPFDWFFIVVFSLFTVTSMISDMLPTLGVDFSQPSPSFLVNANWWYAHDTDLLFMHPPVWMRIVTGLSAFVYPVFYVLLVVSLVKGWNWIQLPSVIYATMIASITGIIVFGVELFGEPEWVTQNPAKFLAFNLPYVLIPILLLARMRKPQPFERRF